MAVPHVQRFSDAVMHAVRIAAGVSDELEHDAAVLLDAPFAALRDQRALHIDALEPQR